MVQSNYVITSVKTVWCTLYTKSLGGELLVARSEPVREEADVELFKDYEASDNEGSGYINDYSLYTCRYSAWDVVQLHSTKHNG